MIKPITLNLTWSEFCLVYCVHRSTKADGVCEITLTKEDRSESICPLIVREAEKSKIIETDDDHPPFC
jgi:hypothetical protein